MVKKRAKKAVPNEEEKGHCKRDDKTKCDSGAITMRKKGNEDKDDDGTKPKPETTAELGLSSRLIVKNLPCGKKTRWDEAKVRAHFAKFGTLTDVRLKLSEKTGACKFAFVGFSSAENCQRAIKAMNGAYIGGTKLTVEECKALAADRTAITKQISLNKIKKRKQNVERTVDVEEEVEGGGAEAKRTDVDTLIEQQILDTGRLFLRNLPFLCSEVQIRQLFVPFGPLAELECVVDKAGNCKGYALCTFIFPEHAVAAWKALDGTVFMGRMLHIIAGEEKRVQPIKGGATTENGRDECQSAFQRERHQQRKENDAKGTESTNRCTWNALFLGTDAVAETLAENYELEKRDLLLVDGKQQNSAAVRMAMAEARLVCETRKFLLDNGVRLDAFSQRQPALNIDDQTEKNDHDDGSTRIRRSKTTILVKNLDAKREGKKEWLCSLFGRFGEVMTVLVPPVHGITALVEMANARDAKCAFEALAYSKKHSSAGGRPLFLEWAPSDVFDEAHPLRAIGRYGYQLQQNGQTMVQRQMPTGAYDDNQQQTTAEIVGEERNDGIGGRRGGEEEDSLEQKKQRKQHQSDKEEDEMEMGKQGSSDEEKKHTKILVRNVPFQANSKELEQLFSTFGELKFIRMPKKPGTGGHRGFCFVEFLSANDARRALDALVHSTHLYGRRLVLEWAKPSAESAEEKRQRTHDRMEMAAGVAGQRMRKKPRMRSF